MNKFLKFLVLPALGVTITTSLFATSSSLDNTKVDWWIVRAKDHQTPRANDTLAYKLEDYDAYYVGDTEEKVLYLTFDEGYEKGYTPALLDTLKANDVPAIFFVTTPYVKDNPDLIKRMVDEGHTVANHSKNHPSMPKQANNPDVFKTEFADVETRYEEIIGEPIPKLFRPPMGHYSQKSLAMTKELGYQTIFWSFAYADFDVNKQPNPDYARKLISDNLHNGAIMLLHAVSKTNTLILDDVIKDARAQGYTFESWPIDDEPLNEDEEMSLEEEDTSTEDTSNDD